MFTLLGLTHTGSFNDHIPISYNIHSNSVIRNRPLVLVLLRGSAFDHNFIPHSREHFYKSINSHAVSGQAVADCGLCFIPRSFCELSLVPAKCFHGFFYNVFLVHESTSHYFNNAISYFGVIAKLFLYFTLSSQLPDATSQGFLHRSRLQMSALPISARVSLPPGCSSPLSKNYANDTPTHIKQRAGTRSFLLF